MEPEDLKPVAVVARKLGIEPLADVPDEFVEVNAPATPDAPALREDDCLFGHERDAIMAAAKEHVDNIARLLAKAESCLDDDSYLLSSDMWPAYAKQAELYLAIAKQYAQLSSRW